MRKRISKQMLEILVTKCNAHGLMCTTDYKRRGVIINLTYEQRAFNDLWRAYAYLTLELQKMEKKKDGQ